MDQSDAHLMSWDKVYAARGWGRYPTEDLVRFMARTFGKVAEKSDLRVLEIGCGPCTNLWYLAREGYSVAGIDGSQTALDQGHERLRREGVACADSVDLRQGNFAVLPWSDGSFDAVIDIESISCNSSDVIGATLAEAHRVLKQDGVMFAKMFSPETTGADSGEPIEPGTAKCATDGPCAGQDLSHFFDETEIRNLFGAFAKLNLDWVSRSDHGGRWTVFEWLVSARK